MDDLVDLAAAVVETVSEASGEVVETVIAAGAEVAGAALDVAVQALTPVPVPGNAELPDLTRPQQTGPAKKPRQEGQQP
jgi:hypothetical protein